MQNQPTTAPLSQGVGRSSHDTESQQRYQEGELGNRDWFVTRGSVILSIPQLGWHYVSLEGKAGITKAQIGGQSDIWGTQTVRAVQHGCGVLVATQRSTNESTIICQLSPEVSQSSASYVETSFYGSWTGLSRDPSSKMFGEITADNDDIQAYDINPHWDQHGGDWGCRASNGIVFNVDTFGIRLATDDITGIYVDYLSQCVEISSRGLDLQGDGVMLSCMQDGKSAVFALGPQIHRELDFDTKLQFGERQNVDESLADWQLGLTDESVQLLSEFTHVYVNMTLDSEDYETNRLRVERDLSTSHVKDQIGQSISSATSSMQISVLPVSMEYRAHGESAGETHQTLTSVSSLQSNTLSTLEAMIPGEEERDNIRGSLKQVTRLVEDVVASAKAASQETNNPFAKTGFNTQPIISEDLLANGPSESDYDEEYRDSESVIARAPGKDAPKGRTSAEKMDALLSMINVDRETGEISLFNEQGAGIRIIGTAVYIEGAQVRLAATKDVVTVARDIHQVANRNVQISANANTRVFSRRNVNILGGVDGTGGVLIESRSAGLDQKIEPDPQETDLSGVIIKSTRSHVSLLGGDVIAKAGDQEAGISGQMAFYADAGDLSLVSSARVVRFATGGHLDVFGSSTSNVTGVNLYSENLSAMNGTVFANGMWSNTDVVARSTVQAITGHMASRQGGPLGRVLNATPAIQTLERLSRTLQDSRSTARDVLKTASERHKGKDRVGHSSTFPAISSGFPREGSTSVYGVKTSVPPLTQEYEQQQPDLEPVRSLEVDYQPDVTTSGLVTRPWPGNNSRAVSVRTSGNPVISRTLKVAQGGSVQWPQYDEREIKTIEVFKTVKAPE